MTIYSEKALRKLSKDGLIGSTLNLQSKMESSNAKVLKKPKLLNNKFDKLEEDVAITRNANSLLSSRLVDTERQFWANAQYSRYETLEIVGLPKSLTNDKADTKLCQIFQILTAMSIKKIWVRVVGLRTRVSYCKVLSKEDRGKVLKAKIDLRKLNTTNLDLPEGSKMFVNQGLCSYYRLL